MMLAHSLRTRIVLLVLVVALAPLGVVGWWQTRAVAQSGEALLRSRLNEALERTVVDIGTRWVGQRSALLAMSELATVQRALTGTPQPGGAAFKERAALLDPADPVIDRVSIRDTAGQVVWAIARSDSASANAFGERSASPLVVRLALFERATGQRIGTLDAALGLDALLSQRASLPFVSDAVVTILDPGTGVSAASIPFDAANLHSRRFQWAGEAWIVEHRVLEEPALHFVAAASLTQFTGPFNDASRRGVRVLLSVSVAAVILTMLITTRMTRRLTRLVASAEAIAHGNLSPTSVREGPDEIGRVARAFNAMTASLARTLSELSQREALAQMGTFASQLAHEIRNPLSAIRVDLQLVEERLPPESPLRALQRGALAEIEQLNRIVSGVLQLARSGNVDLQPVDVLEVVRAAARIAQPTFDQQRARLSVGESHRPLVVRGDASALRQLVLNLLLNAAQSLASGGMAAVDARAEGAEVVVTIRDEGDGIPEDQLARVREPFFSTRAEGTGLGLAIADRIARAHRGSLEIASVPGAGTIVSVRLPLAVST